jgi:hypothetical protein
MTIAFQCPTPTCHNRALDVEATTETVVSFTADGRIGHVEYGEWYISPQAQAHCPQCHWDGRAADCRRDSADAGAPAEDDQPDGTPDDLVTCRECDTLTRKAYARPNRAGDCWIGDCCWQDYQDRLAGEE